MTDPLASRPAIRLMVPRDLPAVCQLQQRCYQPTFHEPMQAFAAKLREAPDSCWVVCARSGDIQAYLVTLPVTPAHYPALHAEDWRAPTQPTGLYLHDLAVAPEQSGLGLGRHLFERALAHAQSAGLQQLSLVAVQGSVPYWRRLGFEDTPPDDTGDLRGKLASFGADARLMVRAAR